MLHAASSSIQRIPVDDLGVRTQRPPTMAKVRFEPAGVEVENIQPGTRLVDVTDEHPEAEVPYSCRSASCGTCRVRVKEGAEGLSSADDDEIDVLDIFGNEPDVRLCCQIELKSDVPRLVLEVVDPE